MIEEAKMPAATESEPPIPEFASSQAMENAALAGAAAIQRLVAECNGLRTRLSLQDADLARLRGANEDLRRRFVLLHQRYVELAKKILSQLEQFDGTIREVGQEAANEENGRPEEAMALPQQSQDGSGAGTPKPNGRNVPNILQQPPRAPAR